MRWAASTANAGSRRQGFSGRADWSLIARIKAATSLPVVGNGDIACAEDAARMIDETGCDAVMIGRAAIGDPFIFTQTRALLAGRPPAAPALWERFEVMIRYVESTVACFGEARACFMLRSQLGWFARGLPGAREFRHAIRRIESRAQAMQIIADFQNEVLSRQQA